MKPAMSMYANRKDWQEAHESWLTEVPTFENQKSFMIFKGSADSAGLIFWGTINNFRNLFIKLADWSLVLDWTQKKNYIVLYEGTDAYQDAEEEMAEEDEEDFYDELGNSTPNGLYDAGGHMNSERLADYIDSYRDRMKDNNE